jgi:hypothetical protein
VRSSGCEWNENDSNERRSSGNDLLQVGWFTITAACDVADVSRQSFYDWCQRNAAAATDAGDITWLTKNCRR